MKVTLFGNWVIAGRIKLLRCCTNVLLSNLMGGLIPRGLAREGPRRRQWELCPVIQSAQLSLCVCLCPDLLLLCGPSPVGSRPPLVTSFGLHALVEDPSPSTAISLGPGGVKRFSIRVWDDADSLKN